MCIGIIESNSRIMLDLSKSEFIMGRLGEWDKVEKPSKMKISYTKTDELIDIGKIILIILMGYMYFHYIIMGW